MDEITKKWIDGLSSIIKYIKNINKNFIEINKDLLALHSIMSDINTGKIK